MFVVSVGVDVSGVVVVGLGVVVVGAVIAVAVDVAAAAVVAVAVPVVTAAAALAAAALIVAAAAAAAAVAVAVAVAAAVVVADVDVAVAVAVVAAAAIAAAAAPAAAAAAVVAPPSCPAKAVLSEIKCVKKSHFARIFVNGATKRFFFGDAEAESSVVKAVMDDQGIIWKILVNFCPRKRLEKLNVESTFFHVRKYMKQNNVQLGDGLKFSVDDKRRIRVSHKKGKCANRPEGCKISPVKKVAQILLEKEEGTLRMSMEGSMVRREPCNKPITERQRKDHVALHRDDNLQAAGMRTLKLGCKRKSPQTNPRGGSKALKVDNQVLAMMKSESLTSWNAMDVGEGSEEGLRKVQSLELRSEGPFAASVEQSLNKERTSQSDKAENMQVIHMNHNSPRVLDINVLVEAVQGEEGSRILAVQDGHAPLDFTVDDRQQPKQLHEAYLDDPAGDGYSHNMCTVAMTTSISLMCHPSWGSSICFHVYAQALVYLLSSNPGAHFIQLSTRRSSGRLRELNLSICPFN
eukprot:jgi/Botrbrau1/15340/Bobra.0147s0005.1